MASGFTTSYQIDGEEIFKVILMHNFPKYNKGQTTDPGNTQSTKPDKPPNNKPRRGYVQTTES